MTVGPQQPCNGRRQEGEGGQCWPGILLVEVGVEKEQGQEAPSPILHDPAVAFSLFPNSLAQPDFALMQIQE